VLARAGAQQHCCFPAHPVSAVSAESGSDRAYTMMMMMPALPCFVHHGLHVESVASSGIRSAACNINDSSQVACGVCYSDTQFLAVFFSRLSPADLSHRYVYSLSTVLLCQML